MVEYFIWKNIDNPQWNSIFSLCGLIVLLLEPLCSMFLIEDTKIRNPIIIAYILYLIIFGVYNSQSITELQKNIE